MWAVKREKDNEIIAMCSTLKDAEGIAKVNRLYEAGHTIKYMTARGITSGVDYEPLTRRQLMTWGAKYHELSVGKKEHYDVWIDDKAFWSENFFRETGETYE
jgi:hypothetical protein